MDISRVRALLRARTPILWIESDDEMRVVDELTRLAATMRLRPFVWDCLRGMTPGIPNMDVTTDIGSDVGADLDGVLRAIASAPAQPEVVILLDAHRWLGSPVTTRAVRNAARAIETARDPSGRLTTAVRRIVIVAPQGAEMPGDLKPDAVRVEWALPDVGTIRTLVAAVVSSAVVRGTDGTIGPIPCAAPFVADTAQLDGLVNACRGLTVHAIEQALAEGLAAGNLTVESIARVKAVTIRAAGLTVIDVQGGMSQVGGLDLFQSWAATRRAAFSTDARDYGLPVPKGALLVGWPGTGKSLCAQMLAAEWRVPCIKLDIGGTRSKYVGSSEENIRRALQTVGVIGTCVLWIDEIEKALAGSTGPAGDGGVASYALGTLLGWLQDRTEPVFLLATANDVTTLPLELLRAGRFDALFFVDIPTARERAEIVRIALGRVRQALPDEDVLAIAARTSGYSGAEITAVVHEAAYVAFAAQRAIEPFDLEQAISAVVPLSATMPDKLKALRSWAKGRCKPASSAENTGSTSDDRSARFAFDGGSDA